MLDIGCGPALTSIMFALECGNVRLGLMDGSGGFKQMGYHETKLPWVGTQMAEDIAELNGVQFDLVRPDPSETWPCDGAMSLLSWGHHYPVSTYLQLVRRSLVMFGSLVLDLRRGKNGWADLEAGGFEYVKKLDETEKLERFHCRKVR